MKKAYSLGIFFIFIFFTLQVRATPLQTPTVVVTPASTTTSSNGAINLTVVGGYAPFEFVWSNGATTEDISNLVAGTYNVEVYDLHCGMVTLSVVVPACNSAPYIFDITEVHTNASSPTSSDGQINITVAGSTSGNISFKWFNSAGVLISLEEDISNLSVGTYCLYAFDACGVGISNYCVTITSCNTNAAIISTYAYCSLSLSVQATGQGPFTYLWSNGATTATIENIQGGSYCVSVTNNNNCTVAVCKNFNAPPQVLKQHIEIYAEEQPCPGDGFGVLQVFVQSNPGATYSWSNGSTDWEIDQLTEGIYCVTVTNTSGCSQEACYQLVNEPGCSNNGCEDAIYGIMANRRPCFGLNNGSIEVYLDQIQFPVISYLWSNGATTPIIENIPAGAYCVTVTQSNACTSSGCFNLTEQTFPLTLSLTANSGTGPYANDNYIYATVSGGSPPYIYEWTGPNGFVDYTSIISGLEPGYYCLQVFSQGCFRGNQCILLEPYVCPNSIYDILTIQKPCSGQSNGSIEVYLEQGYDAVSYLWSNGATTAMIENIPAGNYCVIVTEINGCTSIDCITLKDEDPFVVKGDILNVCNISDGSITIDPSDIAAPFTLQWSNGQTAQYINNLVDGNYCVTVTDADGCTGLGCFEVKETGLEVLSSEIIDNGCFNDCTGSIVLDVASSLPIAYEWSNGGTSTEIKNLCAGTYTVTLTSGDCVKEYTYVVEEAEEVQNFTYEVDILANFNNDIYVPGNSATLRIYSDLIVDYGNIHINECNVDAFTVDGSSSYIELPISCNDVETFHFVYTDPNGCTYEGTFNEIPTCVFPDNQGFSFNVTHLGNSGGSCGAGQQNSYEITPINIGNNEPYYIRVFMEDAFPSEMDYIQEVDFNGQTPFIINGIPDGRVRFQSWNYCEHSGLFSRLHTNCCFDISCDVQYEGTSDSYDGSRFFDFNYFRLWAKQECFDSNCTVFDNDCSRIWVDLNNGVADDNCWTGTVSVQFPDEDEPPAVFEVSENSFGGFEIDWVSGDEEWDVPSQGAYFVTINYVGSGGSVGQDCETEQEINFFGDTNGNDAVGFNDDYWFNGSALGVPSYFMDSYFGAWKCKVCAEEMKYIFGNDQGECRGFWNWDFTFFHFVPNNPLLDPCNSGGELTIIDFDADGNAIEQTITISPSVDALGALPGMQPFGISENTFCPVSGWCLFDALDVYGFEMDKPLLATWAVSSDCYEVLWTDTTVPNPDPCVDDLDCPLGYVCQPDGNCYAECQDGECLYGVCVDGICVEYDDCIIECQEGYECIEGECYVDEDLCGFSASVSGGYDDVTYNFYHDLEPGTIIHFSYNTLEREDEIFITGSGLDEHIVCDASNGWIAPPINLVLGTGNTITVTVSPCQSGSWFHININCTINPFNGDADDRNYITSKLGSDAENIIIYPNPFTSLIEITTSSLEEPFNGEVILLDNVGREVINKMFVFDSGAHTYKMEGLENLTNGVYVVLIKRDGAVYAAKKIIKID